MSVKRAKSALAMGALMSVSVTGIGCGADECTKASEHFSQCLGTNAEANAILVPPSRCETEHLCSSRCVNSHDCDAIREAFGFDGDAGTGDAGQSKAAKDFIECRSKCLSSQ